MIYTVGYAKLTPKALALLAEHLEAIVTDTRAKPLSRKLGSDNGRLSEVISCGNPTCRYLIRCPLT